MLAFSLNIWVVTFLLAGAAQAQDPAIPSAAELAKLSVDDIIAIADRTLPRDFVAARKLYDEAVRREPDNPVVLFKSASHTHADLRAREEAEYKRSGELFLAQMKQAPDVARIRRRVFDLAEEDPWNSNRIVLFDALLLHDPDDLEALLLRQRLTINSWDEKLDFTDYERVFRLLEGWIAKGDGKAARAAAMKALNDTGCGVSQVPRAAVFLSDRMLRWNPDDVEVLVIRAEMHHHIWSESETDEERSARADVLRRADLDRAMAILNAAIEKDPRSAPLRIQRFELNRHTHEGLVDATALIELSPADPAAWIRRGAFLRNRTSAQGKEMLEESIRDYAKAIELDPDNKLAIVACAEMYWELGEFERAAREYARVIEIDPTAVSAYVSRASIYVALVGKLKDEEPKFLAIAELLKARKLGNKDVLLSQLIGQVGNDSKGDKAAMAGLNRIIEMDPTTVEAYVERARTHFIHGRRVEALADSEIAIRLRPGDEPLVNLKWTYYQIQKLDLPQDARLLEVALEDATQMLATRPKQEITWLLVRGNILARLQREALAMADLDRAIELDPKSAQCWETRGNAWRRLRKWDSAIADLTKAIELKPADMNLRSDRAEAWIETATPAPAIEDYEAFLAKHPNSPVTQDRLARIRTRLKDWDGLLADWTRRIQENPENPDGYKERARVYESKEDLANAINDYSSWLELAPRNLDALFGRAEAYEKTGETDKALADWDTAAGITKVLDQPRIRSAALRERLGDHSGAIAAYTLLIQEHPKDTAYVRKRAACYLALKDTDAAIAEYSTAIEINPEEQENWVGRGWVFLGRKEYDRALDDFRHARDLDRSGLSWDWINVGVPSVYEARGVKDWERIELDATLALNPANAVAAYARGYLRYMDQDLVGACEDFTRAVEAEPQSMKYRLIRMSVYRDRGMIGLALDDATAAIEAHPKDSQPLRERSWIHWKQGDHEKALADLAKAAEVDPGNPLNHSELEKFKGYQFENKWMKLNTRGIQCYDQGNWTEAIKFFNEALALNPGEKGLATNRALAVFNSGDTAEARSQFESILSRDPNFALAKAGLVQVVQRESFDAEWAYKNAAARAAENRRASCKWCGGRGETTYKGTTSVTQVSTRNDVDPGIGWKMVSTSTPDRTVKCASCN